MIQRFWSFLSAAKPGAPDVCNDTSLLDLAVAEVLFMSLCSIIDVVLDACFC